MKQNVVGKKILIHGYKHNGKIHRCWSRGLVLQETEDHFIVINNRTLVTESDGRMWHTREPAIWYMPKKKWYNVICMIRKTGVYYYCNIASPTLYDGEALKYIDYDLDLKVFPDGNYRVLDQEEYRQHAKEMGYSDELDKILKKQLDILIKEATKNEGPFDSTFTILKQYQGDYVLSHFDAYRLEGQDDDLGFEEIFDSDDICVVEWPEFIQDILPKSRLEITIKRTGDIQREFVFHPIGKQYEDLVGEL